MGGHPEGEVASQLALAHPDRVASLTLIASAGLGSEINVGYTGGFAAAGSRRDLKPLLEQLFNDGSLVSRQMIDDVLKYKRLDGVDALLTELNAGLIQAGRVAIRLISVSSRSSGGRMPNQRSSTPRSPLLHQR